MATSETLIPIPGRLKSVASEEHVAGADMIYDDDIGKLQSTINSEVNTALGTKVDKVSGKGLSTNDYTTAEKNKLAGIAEGAQVNTISGIQKNGTDLTPDSNKKVNITVPTKTSDLTNDDNVVKDANYVHTDNNFTGTLKTKLDNIAAGAEVNVQSDWNQSDNTKDDFIKNKPTLGTAAAKDFVTTVDTSASLVTSGATKTYVDGKHAEITDLIPTAASSTNQLADKSFVNSSISTATATYRGSKNLVSDLSLPVTATNAQVATALATAITGADNNDYCFVQIPTAATTPTEIARIDRYKYNGSAWSFEYTLNNSGYTSVQWAAINSGITSSLVTKLDGLPDNSGLTTLLNNKADKSATVSTIAYDTTNKKITKTINGTASDVVTSVKIVEDGGGNLVKLNVIDLESLAHSYSFKVDDALYVGGALYKCTSATTKPPFDFVFDSNNALVIDRINGYDAVVCDSNTLNTGWAKVADFSEKHYVEQTRTELQKNINSTRDALQNSINTTASTLQTNIDNSMGIAYGTCGTAGATASKTVMVENFRLAINRSIAVLFVNGFTATSPTLNVNGTGAKPIKYFGEAIAPNFVPSNTIVTMSYDGTNWNVISIRTLSGLQSGIVDLGLPSGLLWADKNIGANSITDFGLYFQWGGTTGYTIEQASQVTTESYNASSAHSISADLSLSEDAARVKLGSPWRMPTKAEAQELIAYCSFETTTINNVSGIKATGPNGNSIFFPEAGMITASGNFGEGGWIMLTSSLSSFEPSVNAAAFANSAGATWGARFSISDCDRARGVVIRPVM